MLLVISFCGLAAWILNGTLYARAKILIPFVPLIILICTELLQELKMRTVTWKLWPCLFLFPTLISKWGSRNFYWIALDICLLVLVILCKKYLRKNSTKNTSCFFSHLLLCLMPCLLFYHTSQKEDYVKATDVFSVETATPFMPSNKHSSLYRYEDFYSLL